MSKFKVGDIVRFSANNSTRTDYLADLESDWADHMLTEADYGNAVRVLEGGPCVIMKVEPSSPPPEPPPHWYYLRSVTYEAGQPFNVAEDHLTKV